MPPSIALLVWFVLLVALLYFDPAKERGISTALWVPVIWMFIAASRLPSQWLGGEMGQAAEALEEGNPLDRSILFGLILLAIGILISRSFKWGDFCVRNLALMAFLSFALVSFIWSDFPLVALKRWFRDLGSYLVVLVALSDARPVEAVRTVLRRLCYLLVPLSILLIKYFAIGRHFSFWTGAAEYVGAATSKNMLGLICLVSGLFFFWDTSMRWPIRRERRTRRIILLNVALMAMTIWLLHLSSSATSRVCVALGCLVIAAAHTKAFRRRPGLLKVLVPAGFVLYVVLAFGLGLNGALAGAVGRDPTLTDRTKIWTVVLAMHTNPVLGTGYESFWLGPRLLKIWQAGLGGINEAHNGYLQVYVNLGLIGVLLLCGFLIDSYRRICRNLKPLTDLGSLSLGVWTVLVFYNMSEAAFQGGLPWMMLLLGVVAVAGRVDDRRRPEPNSDQAVMADGLPGISLETIG